MNPDVISDDQGGEPIGSVANYISRFKKIDAGEEVRNVPEFTSVREKIVTLPSEWTADNEKEILTHYYRRFGDHTCTDFQTVSSKIASSVNRLFNKNFTPSEVEEKLEKLISVEDVDAYDDKVQLPKTEKKETVRESKKIKISLRETSYDYIKDRPQISDEYMDLVPFVDPEKICFSSDGSKLFIATKQGFESCFEDLFDFSDKEEMVFQMFKEQLGDEIKAKKLVLMSRILNNSPSQSTTPREPKPKKEVPLKPVPSKKTKKSAQEDKNPKLF